MKKTIYIFFWAILMLILSFIAHAGIEIWYLKWQEKHNIVVKWIEVIGGGTCALPIWLIYLLSIVFIAFGIWCGFFFWKRVYKEQ